MRSLWEERDFSEESIDPEVFRHDGSDATLKEFTALRRGRSLVAQKRCGSCHDSGTEELMPELLLKGPSLDGIGDRLRHDWLARWILDPRKIRPQSHMPAVFRVRVQRRRRPTLQTFFLQDLTREEWIPFLTENRCLWRSRTCSPFT